MSRVADIVAAVADVYAWIDGQTASWSPSCRACGECCDFEEFGHRLFLTSVELMYFHSKVPPNRREPMTGGICPYRVNSRCSVHSIRFAGCRTFSCSGPTEPQGRLSEEALARFKRTCEQFHVPYAYMDLKTALNGPPTVCLED